MTTATMAYMAIASAAISAGTAVHSNRQQNKAFEKNQEAAQQSAVLEQSQLNQRLIQEQQAAATQKQDLSLAAEQQLARNKASQLEAGISLNNDTIAADIMRQVAVGHGRIETNLGWTESARDMEMQAVGQRRQSRINQVSKGSNTALALELGQAGLTGARGWGAASARNPNSGTTGTTGTTGYRTGNNTTPMMD